MHTLMSTRNKRVFSQCVVAVLQRGDESDQNPCCCRQCSQELFLLTMLDATKQSIPMVLFMQLTVWRKKKMKCRPLPVSYQDMDLTVRNPNLYLCINLFRHFSHHAAKLLSGHIRCPWQPAHPTKLGKGSTSSPYGQIPCLPNCYLQADCLCLGISESYIPLHP